MSQEFEDRESELSAPDNLGELPTGISRERNELYRRTRTEAPPQTPVGTPRPAGVPNDVAMQARAYGDGKGELGSPIIPASVTSTYDARPVNARDFVSAQEVQIVTGTSPETINAQTLSVDYTVPVGYTGILRGFQFFSQLVPEIPTGQLFQPSASLVPSMFTLTSVSILLDGSVQPDFNNLPFGAIMDTPQECFIIAGELQKITLQVTFSQLYVDSVSIASGVGTKVIPVLLSLYGNNLLTRGLPKAFEVSSQDQSGLKGNLK